MPPLLLESPYIGNGFKHKWDGVLAMANSEATSTNSPDTGMGDPLDCRGNLFVRVRDSVWAKVASQLGMEKDNKRGIVLRPWTKHRI
jgi:hypothetical protein